MKTKDIAKQYGIDVNDFDSFLKRQSTIKVSSFMGNAIADEDVKTAVELYKKEKDEKDRAAKEKADAAARALAERHRKEQEKKQAIAAMLVSSGFNFDGYTVKKYSGYISGDDTIEINRDDLNKNNGQYLCDCLAKIRIQALKELKEAAYDLGCNAIIGVDFDYMTFEPETIDAVGTHYYMPYMLCVTANGNAVVIEKN